MYAVLKSFGLKGLNGFPVEVEADISGGMPALSIVGLPDSAVRESGDRVHAALKNLGFKWPDRRITINLAPADVRKTGPVYDLPLLLAVLAASGQLEPPPKDTAFLGELALDGSLRPVSGVLPMALEAAAGGVRAIDAKRLPTVRNGMLSMWRFVRFVLGYRRSQKRHPQRVAVETSADRCTHCGRCVKLCPTGAIVAGDELHTDAAKCIRCCACVKGCPVGARSYDSPFAPVLSRNFAQRKRNLTLM